INGWPVFASQANTAQPLEVQTSIFVATSLIVGMFTAAGLALVAGIAQADMARNGILSVQTRLVIGISAGLVMAGAGALARHVVPSASPLWGNLAPASAVIPFASSALGAVTVFFTQTLILLTVLYGLRQHSGGSAVWILVGIALAGLSPIETIASWLIIGVLTGILLMFAYRFVFRHEPQILLITTATIVILSWMRGGIRRIYPSAFFP